MSAATQLFSVKLDGAERQTLVDSPGIEKLAASGIELPRDEQGQLQPIPKKCWIER